MDLMIAPSVLTGTVTPPPSKSQAHRLIIAAALARGESRIQNVALSKDVLATLNCMRALGAVWSEEGGCLRLHGIGSSPEETKTPICFDCGESGSTLRFLIPIALVLRGGGIFCGRGRLMQRPQQPYFDIFDQQGIHCRAEGDRLYLQGRLVPGLYELPGNVSSQFVTGLLYALPLLDGDCCIRLTTPLESAGYVRMTLQALQLAGIKVLETSDGFGEYRIFGGQSYRPIQADVEPDWSQAAFFCAAAALGNPVQLSGLRADSCQGDAVYPVLSRAMSGTDPCVFDVSGCPDLVPPLALEAAFRAPGAVTRLTNAGRLRIKESDRLAAVTGVMGALGAEIEQAPEELIIRGCGQLRGGATVDSCNDHRIAMMAAIAATRCQKPVILTGAECVEKSFPDFWQVYTGLGGKTEDVIHLRR